MVIPSQPGVFAYRCFDCGHRWSIAADADLRRSGRDPAWREFGHRILRQNNRRRS